MGIRWVVWFRAPASSWLVSCFLSSWGVGAAAGVLVHPAGGLVSAAAVGGGCAAGPLLGSAGVVGAAAGVGSGTAWSLLGSATCFGSAPAGDGRRAAVALLGSCLVGALLDSSVASAAAALLGDRLSALPLGGGRSRRGLVSGVGRAGTARSDSARGLGAAAVTSRTRRSGYGLGRLSLARAARPPPSRSHGVGPWVDLRSGWPRFSSLHPGPFGRCPWPGSGEWDCRDQQLSLARPPELGLFGPSLSHTVSVEKNCGKLISSRMPEATRPAATRPLLPLSLL